MAGDMVYERTGEIEWLRFVSLERLGPYRAFFTSRSGGVSPAPFESLNLGFGTKDDPELVRQNRYLAYAAMGLDHRRAVGAIQIHGDHVAHVTGADAGCGSLSLFSGLKGYDVLTTATPDLTLTMTHGDCAPIYLVDPRRRAVSLVHAGWQGTLAQVAATAVRSLQERWRTDPADLYALIGPSIGPCCYQVGELVWETAKSLGESVGIREDGPGHWRLDLWETNRRLLQAAGVPEEQIMVSGICTACNPDRFYSHRGSGGKTGRNLALLRIEP